MTDGDDEDIDINNKNNGPDVVDKISIKNDLDYDNDINNI